MRSSILFAALTVILIAVTANAASLEGRLGINAKVGALVPLEDEFISGTSDSETDIAAGGGLIFGLSRNLAAEIDVTHVPGLNVEIANTRAFEASFTNVALGVQYRVASDNRLVPFLGAGMDFIKGTLEDIAGSKYNLEWTFGGHINAGVDYFITEGIALSAEARGVIAKEGDVERGDTVVAEYDPMSFICTIGLRLILPRSAFW